MGKITRPSTAIRLARQLLEREKWIKRQVKTVDKDDTSCGSVGRCAIGALAEVTGDIKFYGDDGGGWFDVAYPSSELFIAAEQVLNEVAQEMGGTRKTTYNTVVPKFPTIVDLNDYSGTQHNFVIQAFIEAEKRAKSAERKAAAK